MSANTMITEPQNLNRKHKIVSQEEWIAARKELLKKEKESTRLLDQLSAERRNLPWVKVEKNYVFDAPGGKVTLADLFGGRNQLVIYHFMFGPDWQEGCPSCSFVSDHIDGALPHLAARDVTMAAISRAPLAKINAFKRRMGWRFNWVSSHGGDFNADFHVSFTTEEIAQGEVDYNYTMQEFPSPEAPGLSVFYKDDDGGIFHTYSTYGRGLEALVGAYRILDLAPKGRDEDHLGFPMEWVRYHDRYATNEFADADKPYWPETASTASTASHGIHGLRLWTGGGASVNARHCCQIETRAGDDARRPASRLRQGGKMAGWIAPTAGLALVPKCPACVAAYVALATGIGISLPAAAYLRAILVVVCVALLVFMITRRLRSLIAGGVGRQ